MGVATSCLIPLKLGESYLLFMIAGQLHLHTNQLKICAFMHICAAGHTVQSLDSICGMLIVLKMRLQRLGIMLERIIEDRRAAGLA